MEEPISGFLFWIPYIWSSISQQKFSSPLPPMASVAGDPRHRKMESEDAVNGSQIVTSSPSKSQDSKSDISMWAHACERDLCLCSFCSVLVITVQVLQETPVSPVVSMPLKSWDASEVCVIWRQFCHSWWPFVCVFQKFQLQIVWRSGGILPKAVELAGLKCLLQV